MLRTFGWDVILIQFVLNAVLMNSHLCNLIGCKNGPHSLMWTSRAINIFRRFFSLICYENNHDFINPVVQLRWNNVGEVLLTEKTRLTVYTWTSPNK